MVLQPFVKERKPQTHERKKEENSSGNIWHETYIRSEDREMKHLRQKEERRTVAGKMREIFHTRNAYGEVSLGMNRKGETMLVAERERFSDGPTVERNSKILDEDRSYEWRGQSGMRMVNMRKPAESAYALRSTHRSDKETRHRGESLLAQSQDFAQRVGQDVALSMFPEKNIRVGETKEKTARELKLAHQLELALRSAEERIVKRKRDEDVPIPMLYVGRQKDEDDDSDPKDGNNE